MYDGKVAEVNTEVGRMVEDVQKVNTKVEQQTSKLLTIITKVQRNCFTKIRLIENRVKALEQQPTGFGLQALQTGLMETLCLENQVLEAIKWI